MGTKSINLDERELATILAALRYWKREGFISEMSVEHEISTDSGRLVAMSRDEIDSLCEGLNS